MYILTDKYGLRYGNVLEMDDDLNEIKLLPDTMLWIGESDEEIKELPPDERTL